MKIEGSLLRCKVKLEKNVVSFRERVEMVEGSKYGPSFFPCCPVVRQCLRKKTQIEKKITTMKSLYLSSIYVWIYEPVKAEIVVFWQIKQINPSVVLAIEVIIILYININSPSKFRSDWSYVSGLLERLISFVYRENLNSQNIL